MSYQQILRRKLSTRVVVKVTIQLAILIIVVILALTASAHASVNQLSMRVSADSYPASNDTQWRPWAQKWHRIAVKERRTLVRHVEALGLGKMPRKVPTIRDWTVTFTTTDPLTGETTVTTLLSWHHYGDANKRAAKAYRARTTRLHHKLVHPGGSSNGARWKPLARYCKWPEYAIGNLSCLIMNESSGRPKAVSDTNDHGLVQFNAPSWSRTWARVMKCPFFPNVYNPELNLRFAYHVFHVVQGNSFLPAWRGDPAATF